jgi:hypothetical protein
MDISKLVNKYKTNVQTCIPLNVMALDNNVDKTIRKYLAEALALDILSKSIITAYGSTDNFYNHNYIGEVYYFSKSELLRFVDDILQQTKDELKEVFNMKLGK